jgi:hypothetical protein
MKKLYNLLLISCFFLIIFGMGIMEILKPDRAISEIENRPLTQKPIISKSTIVTGDFFSNFEKYFADQLYGRDYIIKAYTKEELLLNKTVINNNVVAKDNWLLFSPIDKLMYNEIDNSEKNLKSLSDSLKGSGVEIYFAAAPYKMNILKNKYPNYLNNHLGVANSKYFLEHLPSSIHAINLYDYFKNTFSKTELEKMYFRTDHHWNYEGAFTAYQQIIETMDRNSTFFKGAPVSKKDLQLKCNNKANFIGSINLQMRNLIDSSGEMVCYYSPAFDPINGSFQAKDWSGNILTNFNQTFGTGFNKDALQYGDIFTWDLPEINYEYHNANNNLHLLILKDSYGNSAQPYIAKHFKKTSVLDLRHYHEKTIKQYINDNHVNIVLFLYNDSNLFGEMYNF